VGSEQCSLHTYALACIQCTVCDICVLSAMPSDEMAIATYVHLMVDAQCTAHHHCNIALCYAFCYVCYRGCELVCLALCFVSFRLSEKSPGLLSSPLDNRNALLLSLLLFVLFTASSHSSSPPLSLLSSSFPTPLPTPSLLLSRPSTLFSLPPLHPTPSTPTLTPTLRPHHCGRS
jgi:hypothetical protein